MTTVFITVLQQTKLGIPDVLKAPRIPVGWDSGRL